MRCRRSRRSSCIPATSRTSRRRSSSTTHERYFRRLQGAAVRVARRARRRSATTSRRYPERTSRTPLDRRRLGVVGSERRSLSSSLLNVFNFENDGPDGRRATRLARQGSRGAEKPTPIVVFTHVPLYALYPAVGMDDRGWREGLGDAAAFRPVTVLNGHIHQIVTQHEGNIRLRAPTRPRTRSQNRGAAPKPGPVTLPHDDLLHAIGYRTVEIDDGNLRFEDRPFG